MDPNKNRLEIRLDPDSLELLNSLIARTSLTKTSLIKKALIVYASSLKNGHIYTVALKQKPGKIENKHEEEVEDQQEINIDEEFEKLNKEIPYKY